MRVVVIMRMIVAVIRMMMELWSTLTSPHETRAPLAGSRKDQGFDDHGDRMDVLPLLRKIDEIEVADGNLIHRDHILPGNDLAVQHRAYGATDVSIEHQRQRDVSSQGLG